MGKRPYNISPDANTPMPIDFYVNQLQITSRSTLWQWSKEGLRMTRVGGRVFLSQADLQRFMNERTKEVGR